MIAYLDKEKAIVQENTDTLTGYIRQLETEMDAKRSIMAGTQQSSKEYRQALADLEALQERHKAYSETLLQNRIDLEKLTQAMKEQQDAVRSMEIDLRKLIHDAIQDREALKRQMLDGAVNLENEIISIITKRYEKERDQLLELAQARRDELEEE